MAGNSGGGKGRILTAALSLGLLIALAAGAILVSYAQANFVGLPRRVLSS
jgi:ABC-type nickel/cobalt efflux system permease component RcnA